MSHITASELKAVRGEFGLSQDQFAKGAGVPQSCLSRVETGEGKLNEENEAKVCAYIEQLHQPDI